MTIDEKIKRELQIYSGEVEAATQYLYAYLAINSKASRRKKVLAALNEQPLFWRTVMGALQTSVFITLRRIFDQDSNHNIDVLVGLFQKNQGLFSKSNLAIRKGANEHFEPIWLGKYMESAHEPSKDDFRGLRRVVAKARKVYETRYRDLSHKVFAHLELYGPSETEDLTKVANVNELKKLLSTLNSIHSSLFSLYHNGYKPIVTKRRYASRPSLPDNKPTQLHERIFHEAEVLIVKLGALTKSK